jgi:hypothetical protein
MLGEPMRCGRGEPGTHGVSRARGRSDEQTAPEAPVPGPLIPPEEATMRSPRRPSFPLGLDECRARRAGAGLRRGCPAGEAGLAGAPAPQEPRGLRRLLLGGLSPGTGLPRLPRSLAAQGSPISPGGPSSPGPGLPGAPMATPGTGDRRGDQRRHAQERHRPGMSAPLASAGIPGAAIETWRSVGIVGKASVGNWAPSVGCGREGVQPARAERLGPPSSACQLLRLPLGDDDANDPADDSDPPICRRAAHVAVQPGLGLLPSRRARAPRAPRALPRAD